ncbi:unnamed protein product [Brugia timori]|uniref:Uncharacterized protein n=1 Tax=Brugia timori TaxID=42155 RepID=A0A3P7TYK5_9BILA|nr:unnamed protein product [Brugia timori]
MRNRYLVVKSGMLWTSFVVLAQNQICTRNIGSK